MDSHALYMFRCIELSLLGAGRVAPNPMVGAVLVCEDRIVGEGYHQQYGHSHAEVNCIRDAELRYESFENSTRYHSVAEMLSKSTLYVSLEPCAHFGKTPPCADLIIEKRIPRVVVGCRDPFDQVNGKGMERLRAAGVDVIAGVLERECTELNRRFFTFHRRHRPYIILKWAQSSDGKIAHQDRSRIFISHEITNRSVHKWRSEEAAILVGTTTALVDDPSLTTRLWMGNNPTRLVIDMNLRLPSSLKVFNTEADTILFNKDKHEKKGSLLYYKIESDASLVQEVTHALYELNLQSVLVEGGATLLQSFIDENLWDEARIITNNELQVRNGINSPHLPEAVLTHTQQIHSDTIRFFKPLEDAG